MTAHVSVVLGEGGKTPYLPLVEVAPLVRRVIASEPNATYTGLGVRRHHKGTLHRRTVKGAEFTWQDLYLVRENDLVFSNIYQHTQALKSKHAATRQANAALQPATLERVFQTEPRT